jgi:L-lactate dehydrogenase complex protein LldG
VSESRARILGAIRDALGRGQLDPGATAELERRLTFPRPRIVPARGQVGAADRLALFIAEAERVNATTARVERWAAVPAAYLRAANLPAEVRLAPDPALDALPWSDQTTLTVSSGAARPADAVAVGVAFAAIAETGTVMMLSAPTSPTGLSFLPATHVVVLAADRLVGTYEQAWARLRASLGAGTMPRVVNWITGPSRTADIEQTILLGAHGPRRLRIVIVDEALG